MATPSAKHNQGALARARRSGGFTPVSALPTTILRIAIAVYVDMCTVKASTQYTWTCVDRGRVRSRPLRRCMVSAGDRRTKLTGWLT